MKTTLNIPLFIIASQREDCRCLKHSALFSHLCLQKLNETAHIEFFYRSVFLLTKSLQFNPNFVRNKYWQRL